MNSFIVHFEFVKLSGNSIYIKELGIYARTGGQLRVYIVGPPDGWEDLVFKSWGPIAAKRLYEEQQPGLIWETPRELGISEDYILPQDRVIDQLHRWIRPLDLVWTMGEERRGYLQKAVGLSNVRDLQQVGCPSLISSTTTTACRYKHGEGCAYENILHCLSWLSLHNHWAGDNV